MQVIADRWVVVLQVDGVPVEDAIVSVDLVHQFLRDHAPGSN